MNKKVSKFLDETGNTLNDKFSVRIFFVTRSDTEERDARGKVQGDQLHHHPACLRGAPKEGSDGGIPTVLAR